MGLVVLRGVAPLLVGVEVARREEPLEGRTLVAVLGSEAIPVEIGPLVDAQLVVDERRRARRRVGAELADEAHHPGQATGELGEVLGFAVAPPEPEVAVGAVELGEVGKDARMGDDVTGAVGLLECPLDPAVQHAAIPARELCGRDACEPGGVQPGGAVVGVGAAGIVVRGPHRDRRVVSERVDRRTRLLDRLRAHGPGVAPLEREVLEEQEPEFVGNGVHLTIGDVAVDAKRVEAEIDGRLEVAADPLGRGVGRAARRPGGSWRP